MMRDAFSFSTPSLLHFGAGKIRDLPALIQPIASRVLLVLGSSSFSSSGRLAGLKEHITGHGISMEICNIRGEPSPEWIDDICKKQSLSDIQLVVAIGGGSVIDAGKAIAAMLAVKGSVMDFLEGVGSKIHPGDTLPFIAVPTTSGTGSEATKNAVLSKVGKNGFKKSLRHDNFIPDIALIDPELSLSCPPAVTAGCGLDAFTQLLEAFVSIKASPLTDALAYSGLKYIIPNLKKAVTCESGDIQVRSALSYAAYLSGLCLANAGLGVVHGFASSVGGMFPISHGMLCGTLLGSCTKYTINQLGDEGEQVAFGKYAQVGRLFDTGKILSDYDACNILLESISVWLEDLNIPPLGKFGISYEDAPSIAKITDNKNNPAKLDEDVLRKIIKERI